MIPIQILRVLSTIRQRDVPALLMGGQACVLYGAAEYSRDLDLAVLATNDALPRLGRAIQALGATVIAVPAFEPQFLARGHAVHFSVPAGPDLPHAGPLRVDIMSRMRGVAPFEQLWERRTTIALPDPTSQADVLVDLLSLPDLVTAKKTQRDKDWPILRRLVDASYAAERDGQPGAEHVNFWLAELRSPVFLQDAGGMATVYLAEDLKHDRRVAIKVLKPQLAAVLGAERRDAASEARQGEATRRGRSGEDRHRGRRRAALHACAGRDPSRHQAGEHPAGERPADDGRLWHRTRRERGGWWPDDRDGPVVGHAARHVAGAGDGREGDHGSKSAIYFPPTLPSSDHVAPSSSLKAIRTG